MPAGGAMALRPRRAALVAAVAVASGVIVAAFFLTGWADAGAPSHARPAWTEAEWPFAKDPWGKGRAFRCKAADCGTEIDLFVRAKLGFCNCATGIADDADLERMGDLDLIGRDLAPLGAGRAITVGAMQGRSRAYALPARDRRGSTALSIAFNERCDMIAAVAVAGRGEAAAVDGAIMEFLNGNTVLGWAEHALGL